jgi:hypothetical protein
MMKLLTQGTLLLSTAFLAACGGGGGGSTSPAVVIPTTMVECYAHTAGTTFSSTVTPSVSSYALNGFTQFYTSTTNTVSISDATLNGVAVKKRRVSPIGSSNYADTYVTVDSQQYKRLKFENYNATSNLTNSVSYSGNNRNLNVPSGSAQNYTFTSTSNGSAQPSVSNTLTFVGIEDVTTPYGTFKNACKQTLAQPNGGSDTFWYAPGYGNVKEIYVINYTDGRIPSSVTWTTQAINPAPATVIPQPTALPTVLR